MSDKLFDSFIQEKMQQHVSQVPADMWQRIVNEKDRNDKAFWYRKWYAVAALLLLMLGGAASYVYFMENGTPEVTETVQQTHTTGNSPNSSNQNKSIIPAENSTPSDKENTTEKEVKAQTTGEEIHALVPEKNAENNSRSVINNQKQSSANNSIRFDKEKPNNYYPALTNKDLNKSVTLNNLQQNDQQQNEAVLNSDAKQYSLGMGQVVLRDKNFNSTDLKNYLSSLAGKGIPITACPSEKGERNGAFYLEAYVSPDYNWKKITGNNSSFLSTKDSAENILASFTAGLRFAKPIGNHVMFKAGLQYSQINEKFQVRKENERRTVTVITTRTIQTSPGVFNTVSDTSSVEQIGYITQTSINKYKNVDVPVLLSYEWGNEDIRFGITGGSIINVSSTSKGETIDSSGATYTYDKSNSAYKTNMGVGVYGSFSIIKPLSENADLFAEPYVRYNLSNMTKAGSGFNQKFNSAGINLGIRINIGRQRY